MKAIGEGVGQKLLILFFLMRQVYGVAFSEDGSYFVTSGNRRVRFWYFDTSGRDGKVRHAVLHAQLLCLITSLPLFP